MGGILRDLGVTPVQIGGMPDHVHLLTLSKPSLRVCSEIIRQVKGRSTKWLHEQFSEAKDFAWQDGYGIFSVSYSQVPIVNKYIQKQAEHHRSQSFEKEYFELLSRHKIPFDPRFIARIIHEFRMLGAQFPAPLPWCNYFLNSPQGGSQARRPLAKFQSPLPR